MKPIKSLLITFALLLSVSIATAQLTAPKIEWQNTIGGNSDDNLYSVQQTSDGEYILGGTSTSGISYDKTEESLGGDYWIVKLNSLGAIEWQNTIGGNSFDDLRTVQQTSDGGYILGGSSYSGISGDKTESSFGGYDYWVVKVNRVGTIEWQNTIGGSSDDWLYAVQQTSDGGYILGGYSYSGISGNKTEASLGGTDYWVVKLNSAGVIEWQNTIGGNSDDLLYSVQQTSDGGYILGGSSYSGISGDKTEVSLGSNDYWVVKVDRVGTIEWQNTIGGNSFDDLHSIQQTSDGGYVLGGTSASGISGDKTEGVLVGTYWVVKLNNAGSIEWQNSIGGDGSAYLLTIQQTSDDGYFVGGYSYAGISGDKTEASIGGADYWVLKLNNTGDIEWQNIIGGNDEDIFQSAQLTSDGGYILGGISRSGISGDKMEAALGGTYDYWVVKLYGETELCTVPLNLSVTNITPISAKLNWDTVPGAYEYKLRYGVVGMNDGIVLYPVAHHKAITDLLPNTEYTWQVKTLCRADSPSVVSVWSAKQHFTTASLRVNDNDERTQPALQIYPNPAQDYASIQFTLLQPSKVMVIVCDIAGREIDVLMNEQLPTGEHSVQLNTSKFSKGVYVLKMVTDDGIESQKLIIQ